MSCPYSTLFPLLYGRLSCFQKVEAHPQYIISDVLAMAENYKFSPDAVQKGSSILKILSKSKSHLIYTRNPGRIRFAVIFIAAPSPLSSDWFRARANCTFIASINYILKCIILKSLDSLSLNYNCEAD